MIAIPRVTHFEINADDTNRAKKFYENVFNWEIEKWEGPIEYWLINTGEEDEPGINGGLQKRENPEDQVVNTIEISSIEEYIKKIEKNGGKITVQKQTIPGVGFLAYFKDTEGNTFGLMERDESAQ